ncbi:pentapeptide repeat-containing protein [Fictibacillus nanhaiensis]|uniref:pentapeptide repeat-containing protein n=1 Tax=Fictibacillus nanhaiensis TaxID=742169 RepID=UPI002E1B6686|nr:pentapeptide repeat-containing protein [Fictibacillus nanhaiensis]
MNSSLQADCGRCFGLCCVALPYARSADFPLDKDGGTPCRNLQDDFRCGIHEHLRDKGFKGCTVYECFGAGQKVSQNTFSGLDWETNPELAKEMFDVFPIMQQLQEIMYYLTEAVNLNETKPILHELEMAIGEIEELTQRSASEIKQMNVSDIRMKINELLIRTSELVRAEYIHKKYLIKRKPSDLIGAKLQKADLRGANLRGALLIAANLKNADLRKVDLIGADLRDADLSGADLRGSIFLTQAQVNSAKGDAETKLPVSLTQPNHWLRVKVK